MSPSQIEGLNQLYFFTFWDVWSCTHFFCHSCTWYSQKSFSEEFTSHTTAFDNILCANEITSVCTEHAANLVCEQLEIAIKIDYQIKQEPHDNFMYEHCYKDKTHFVNIDSNSCSCTFSKPLGLPCRHLFATRKHQDILVFCASMMRERWLKSYQIHVYV